MQIKYYLILSEQTNINFMSNFGRMNRLDPSLFFQDTADINPSYQRTNNSYIKLIYNHEDYNSTRTLQLIRDYSINPDIIHYRYVF